VNGFWPARRVLLTGGGGFLGRFIGERLKREQPAEILAPRKRELDLRDAAAVRGYLSQKRPDMIIHAAAVVGGIGANREHPGTFFYENAIMGIQLIEEARRAGVAKFVCLGTISGMAIRKRRTPRTASPRRPFLCSFRPTGRSTASTASFFCQ
jgi:nucleoside-diphosphate-sugar epimerase